MALVTTLLTGIGSGAAGTVTSVSGAGLASGTVTTTGDITVTAATQTTQEAASSNAVAVTPGTQQYHPSAAKAWADFQVDGTLDASYNIASITDTGTGNWTVNIGTDFSGNAYSACAIHEQASTNNALITFLFTQVAAQSVVRVVNTSGTLTDPEGEMRWMAFGDQ